jgi:hypothetical protein
MEVKVCLFIAGTDRFVLRVQWIPVTNNYNNLLTSIYEEALFGDKIFYSSVEAF